MDVASHNTSVQYRKLPKTLGKRMPGTYICEDKACQQPSKTYIVWAPGSLTLGCIDTLVHFLGSQYSHVVYNQPEK